MLAVPMLALAGVTTAGLFLQLEEQKERQIAIAANAVVTASMQVQGDAVDAETGMRGFAATGEPTFLEAYRAGSSRLSDDLKKLHAAASTDAERTQVAQIERTSSDHLAHLGALQQIVQPGTPSSAAAISTQLVTGKQIMDTLRSQIGTLSAEPNAIAKQQRAQIAALELRIQIVEITGLILGLLTGGAGGALFAFGIAGRIRAVAGNAQRLGTGEKLLPVPPAADELGQLGDALSNAERLLANRLDELSAARDEALLATEAKNTFLSRTSHELRTPLNAILGFAQLLELSDLDADDRESAGHINNAGRHLLVLINELIDIARVESGELQVSVEPVSVAAVCRDIVALMNPLAAARDIIIANEITDSTIAVAADHQRLKQVLVNLVSNAVKYNRQGGAIGLSAGEDIDDTIRISVSDTGPGLDESEIVRIWTPFERLGADQGGIEGTGIGLPLARAMTEAMLGTIDVVSQPGSGSVFTVRLPRAPDLAVVHDRPDARTPSVPAQERGYGGSCRLTVLSIEDNTANSQVLERVFRGSGMTLLSAINAKTGITLARERQPDLILLDLHLPEVSGEEAFTRLRSEPSTAGIPIIILSADATPGTIRRLLARGAAAYLTKPLDLAQLQVAVRGVIKGAPDVVAPSRPSTAPSGAAS